MIFEHDDARAVSLARAIDERVARRGRPRLWHGDARANWAVVDAGIAAGRNVRVGLEDTLFDRDGYPRAVKPRTGRSDVRAAVRVDVRLAA